MKIGNETDFEIQKSVNYGLGDRGFLAFQAYFNGNEVVAIGIPNYLIGRSGTTFLKPESKLIAILDALKKDDDYFKGSMPSGILMATAAKVLGGNFAPNPKFPETDTSQLSGRRNAGAFIYDQLLSRCEVISPISPLGQAVLKHNGSRHQKARVPAPHVIAAKSGAKLGPKPQF